MLETHNNTSQSANKLNNRPRAFPIAQFPEDLSRPAGTENASIFGAAGHQYRESSARTAPNAVMSAA